MRPFRLIIPPFALAIVLAGWPAAVGAAEEDAFSNSLAQATLAAQHAEIPAATRILEQAEPRAAHRAANLCALARQYCDLTWLTDSTSLQRDLVARALACSRQAVAADPTNATAHACVAVCYAKACTLADLKTKLLYSRNFKLEAERALALDPRQDIAYYLLGRWNYEIARVGVLARAYVQVIYGGLPKASNAEAIANFQKAIQLAPDRILHHAGLARAYAAAGETPLALEEWKKCRAMTPAGLEDREARREALQELSIRD